MESEPEVAVVESEPEVTVVESEPEVTVMESEPEVTVMESEPEVTVVESEPEVTVVESKPEETRKVSRQRFARTEAVMKTLRERVQSIADTDRNLGASFHFSVWRTYVESLEEAKNALKTSETLLLMAYRLEKTPQAAPHRVKLSLKRCEDRLWDVENIHQMLSKHHEALQQRLQQAEVLLQSLTEDLKHYQAKWSRADVKNHAEQLLQVRQGLAHPPIALQDIEAQLAQLKKEQSEKSKAYG